MSRLPRRWAIPTTIRNLPVLYLEYLEDNGEVIAEGNVAKVNTANVEQFLKNLELTPISETTNEEESE